MRTKQEKPRAHDPWMPPEYHLADVSALQALQRGEADPDQQKRALKYLIEAVCATYDLSYRPSSTRDTDFAEGRRFVGLQIVKLLKINISRLKEAERQREEAND